MMTDMSSFRRRLAVCVAAFLVGVSVALLLAIGSSPTVEAHLIVRPPEWSALVLQNGRTGLLISVGGVLAGLPTIGLLGANGFAVGRMMAGYVVNAGGFSRFLLLTAPHGVMELPALLLFGTVGLGVALHLLSVLGARVEAPSARGLLLEGLTAVILILAAAAVESRITPTFGGALWTDAGRPWVDDSLRWLGVVLVEAFALVSISRAFDAVETLSGPRRRAYAKVFSQASPLAAIIAVGWCLALQAPLVAVWKEGDAAAGILFVLGCGLPLLLYAVARGYAAQTGQSSRKLSIHLPWLAHAGAFMGAGYAILALSYAVLPTLSPVLRALTTGMLTLFLLLLVAPSMLRRIYAQEVPCDWQAFSLRPAAEFLDRLSFPQSRVHLLRMRGDHRVTNAMATGIVPGSGRIFMTEALLELLDPSEVAAVLAHEIGHIRRKHLGYALIFQAVLIGMVDAAFVLAERWTEHMGPGGLGAIIYVLFLIVLGTVALPLVLAGAARVAERDADAFAAENGWAKDLASALEKIPGPDPGSDDTPRFARAYSLHPSRTARIRMLRLAEEAGVA
jgi:Zn-dependent protease with chaperone function